MISSGCVHTNQTGFGCGVPSRPTVVSQITRSLAS